MKDQEGNNKLMINADLGFEEIADGNRIIMDFINLNKEDKMGGFRNLYDNKNFPEPFFHSSMNWIMPVLDKIERMGFDTLIVRRREKGVVYYSCKIKKEDSTLDYVANTMATFKVTAIWHACIKFCSMPEHKELNTVKLKTT